MSGRFTEHHVPPVYRDIQDAMLHLSDDCDLVVDEDDVAALTYHGTVMMYPERFIDDEGFLGREERGWLLGYPREEWADLLRSECSRQLGHVIKYWEAGKMPPGIQIDGVMGDGRGRACFHWAIGEKMPVGVYASPGGRLGEPWKGPR